MNESARSLVAIAAALGLGAAFATEGFRTPRIVLIVIVSILVMFAATASKSLGSLRSVTDRSAARALTPMAVGLFVVQAINYFPSDSALESAVLWIGCGLVALLALLWAFGVRAGATWSGLVIVYGLMMALLVAFTTSNGPIIDVSVFQQDGAAALLRLDNPFAMTFPDIYSNEASRLFYGDGLSVNGVLEFGYPYFPLGLLVVAPFEWISDYRFAHVLAMVVSVVLISRLSTKPTAKLAAVIFMLASPAMLMARVGWMDPLVLVTVVLVTYLAVRGARATSAATGLIYAMKQYTAFLLIPSLLLLERPWGGRKVARHFLSAAAVFLAITLPFAFWDMGAFWWSTVELQFVQPFRPDSIAIPALFPDAWGGLSPLVTVGAPALLTLGASIWIAMKAPTGGQGFALGSAAVMLVGFITSKQAFANYYFVVLGALCAGAAAVPSHSEHSVAGSQTDRREATEPSI